MVPVVLYLFLKKYMKKNWPSIKTRIKQFALQRNFFLMLGFLLLMLLKLLTLHAQQTELQYSIVRNGKVIGWTKLTRSNTNQQVSITMQSEVKARFIFQFLVSAIEQVSFTGGNLVYSSQYRKLNGEIKENKHMKLTSKGYEVYRDDDTQQLLIPPLHFHMLCLYFQEPKENWKVYSDSFERELALERTDDGGYRLKLPDGNSCCYYYQNGICPKVKINQTFYSAEMVLTQ
jgi:hypothetical protein